MTKCEKHPKYKGRRKPKQECTTCLEIYFRLLTPRAPIMPTKTIPDATVYDRRKAQDVPEE